VRFNCSAHDEYPRLARRMTLLASLRLIPGTLVRFEMDECKVTDLLNHER
jgi:hypothetical protein